MSGSSMYRLTLFIVTYILFHSSCFSQDTREIKGILKDSISREGIEYANVTLLKTDSGFIRETATDSTGHFSINISSDELKLPIIMQFNHLVYQKKFITLNDDLLNTDSLLVFLSPNENYLSEVEVIGKVTRINNRHNRMEYLVSDKLRENSMLATRVLENIPGVFVDFNKTIYVNGSSDILILKNGQEMPSNSIVDQIPAASIERVEIWKSIPIKYASQSYSAILNIITKPIESKSLILDNNISFDKTMYDSKVNLNIDLPKQSFYLFYKLYYRDFLEKSSIESPSCQPANDTIYRFTSQPNKNSDNEFFYGYTHYFSKRLSLGADGYLSLYKERSKSNYDDKLKANYSDSKEDFTTQNYKAWLNYEDSINHFNANLQYNNINLSDNVLYYENNVNNRQQDERDSYTAQVDYRRQVRENLDLSAGINYSHISDNNRFTNFSDPSMHYRGDNLSIYAESNIEIKKWSLDAGLNLYNYERNFLESNVNVHSLNLYPKVSITYHPNNHSFQADYYSYINNPSIWQMLPLTRQYSPDVFFNGNPYLKPEKYNVVSFKHNYSKGDFYIENTLYYKLTQNKIQSAITTENSNEIFMSNTNLNKRKDYGYSISIGCPLTKGWNINFFNDLYYRAIDENTFYKTNLFSYSGSIQSVWEITKKLTVGGYYRYNSKNLVFNGIEKPYNSSLMMVKYKLLNNLDIFILAIQPFGNFERKTEIYSENGKLCTINNLKIRTYLLSFTYNLFNSKKKSKKLYYNEYNEEKKY